MRVTLLVSEPNPLPSAVMSLAAIRSRFLLPTLALAFSTRFWLSAANPTRTKLPLADLRMSVVLAREMFRSSSAFLIFWPAVSVGR